MVVLIHTKISGLTPISRLIHIPMIILTDIGRHIYHVIGKARYVSRLNSMDTSKFAHIHVGSYIDSDIACGILEREQIVSNTDGYSKHRIEGW